MPDCGKPARSKRADYCGMHYHRLYRHGRLDAQANVEGVSVSNGRRYRRRRAHGHPLADASGNVYVHRAVLYDSIGPGPHACHWCAAEVDWLPRGDPAAIHVDHLNDMGDDNRPENLAPSCATCNSTRGMQARHDALVEAGWWSVNDTVAALRNGGRRPRVA